MPQSAYDLAVPPSVALPRALEASNRAIALDAGVPEAWAARAFARFVLEGNWAAAESDFKRALQLGPESVDVLEVYSNFLTDRGRHAEAIAVGRKAEERAPFSAATSRQVAWAYYMAGQHDDAIRQARQVLANEPKFVSARTVLGRSLLFVGKTRAFASWTRRAAIKDGRSRLRHGGSASRGRAARQRTGLTRVDRPPAPTNRPHHVALCR